MSAALFVRELRRQGLLALALVLLCTLIGAGCEVLSLLGVPGVRGAEWLGPVWLLFLLSPWLLGVATFVPEREAGAEAFLGILPLSRGRLLALRASACLVACAANLGLGTLVGHLAAPQARLRAPEAWALSGVALLAAWVASLSFKRSLSAFAAAPILAAAGLYTLVLPWELIGSPSGFKSALLVIAVCGVAGAIPWIHARYQPLSGAHPAGAAWRPLLGLALVSCGLASATRAADQASSRPHDLGYRLRSLGPEGPVEALALVSQAPWSKDQGAEFVLVREGPSGSPLLAWLPSDHHVWSLSPTHVLTSSSGACFVWELERLAWSDADAPGSVTSRSQAKRVSNSLPAFGEGTMGPLGRLGTELVWAGGEPFATARGAFVSITGRTGSLPEGFSVRDTGCTLVCAQTPDGIRLISLDAQAGPEQLSEAQRWRRPQELYPELGEVEDLAISPGGTMLTWSRLVESHREVWALDLSQPTLAPKRLLRTSSEADLDVIWNGLGGLHVFGPGSVEQRVDFPQPDALHSPRGDRYAVAHWADLSYEELIAGSWRKAGDPETSLSGPPPAHVLRWLKDGRLLYLDAERGGLFLGALGSPGQQVWTP